LAPVIPVPSRSETPRSTVSAKADLPRLQSGIKKAEMIMSRSPSRFVLWPKFHVERDQRDAILHASVCRYHP
jgi:hypothetical protein